MSSEVLSLRHFVSLQRGTTYKGALVGLPGPVLLGLASIQPNGGFRHGGFKTYGGECPEKISLKSGDIYVSLKDVTQSGDLLGSVSQVPPNIQAGRLTQDTVKLVFDGAPISRQYLYWVLRTPVYREYCRSCGTGTTTLGLARDDFLDFPILNPTSADLLLVDLLEGIEKRIVVLRETNATLEAIAQALFKSWFVDFDPVHAKQQGRAPEGMDEATAALFPDRFEESELGSVPKGWRVGAFSHICSISSGKRPPDRSDAVSDECLIPLYGGAGLMGFTSAPLFDEPKILTGRVGTLGKIHIAYPPFWASDNVLVITPNDKSAFSLVLHWLRSVDVAALNRGSTQPLLTQRDLGAQLGVIPPSRVVAVFEEVVAHLYQRVRDQELQAQTLTALRDTLLPRLISGQLRLPEASSVS